MGSKVEGLREEEARCDEGPRREELRKKISHIDETVAGAKSWLSDEADRSVDDVRGELERVRNLCEGFLADGEDGRSFSGEKEELLFPGAGGLSVGGDDVEIDLEVSGSLREFPCW